MFRRRLQLESLEARFALTGNVTAVIADGDLFLTGDSAANVLQVERRNTGNMEITGLAGTTINGSSSFPVVISGLTGDLHADLLGGNDDILFERPLGSGVDLPGSVLVNLGSGDDELTIKGELLAGTPVGTLGINGSLIAFGRDGNDGFHFDHLVTTADVLVYGGDGDDEFSLSGEFDDGNQIGGQILADMSTGDDTIAIHGMRATSVLLRDPIGVTIGAQVGISDLQVLTIIELYMSIQDDHIDISGTPQSAPGFNALARDLVLHTGNGDDVVQIHDALMQNLTMYTGEGNEGGGFYGVQVIDSSATNFAYIDTAGGLDNVLLDSFGGGSRLYVNTGSASDGVIMLNATADFATIDTQDGGDVVGIHGSLFTNLEVLLWTENDLLVVSTTTVEERARFDGNQGVNQFIDGGGNSFGEMIAEFFS